MRALPFKYDERRLAASVNFYLKHLGTVNGRFAVVIFFNQVKYQVEE